MILQEIELCSITENLKNNGYFMEDQNETMMFT